MRRDTSRGPRAVAVFAAVNVVFSVIAAYAAIAGGVPLAASPWLITTLMCVAILVYPPIARKAARVPIRHRDATGRADHR